MRQGPEFRNGWQHRFEIDGQKFVIEARHASHQRTPRGHEIAGQFLRGGNLSMVRETDYGWVVYGEKRRPAPIRQNPNGTFSAGGSRSVFRTVQESAEAFVRKQYGLSQQPEQDSPGFPHP